MNSESKTEVIKLVNNNGGFKITIKNIGIVAVVVITALSVYGFINARFEAKADKVIVSEYQIKQDAVNREVLTRLTRIETLLERK